MRTPIASVTSVAGKARARGECHVETVENVDLTRSGS
ncbi:hypothetical protein BH18GEM1_BH18GEM1_14260 [soil metagenome]